MLEKNVTQLQIFKICIYFIFSFLKLKGVCDKLFFMCMCALLICMYTYALCTCSAQEVQKRALDPLPVSSFVAVLNLGPWEG